MLVHGFWLGMGLCRVCSLQIGIIIELLEQPRLFLFKQVLQIDLGLLVLVVVHVGSIVGNRWKSLRILDVVDAGLAGVVVGLDVSLAVHEGLIQKLSGLTESHLSAGIGGIFDMRRTFILCNL